MEQVLTILCNNRLQRLAMLLMASGGSCTLLAVCDSGGSCSVRPLWVPGVLHFSSLVSSWLLSSDCRRRVRGMDEMFARISLRFQLS